MKRKKDRKQKKTNKDEKGIFKKGSRTVLSIISSFR